MSAEDPAIECEVVKSRLESGLRSRHSPSVVEHVALGVGFEKQSFVWKSSQRAKGKIPAIN